MDFQELNQKALQIRKKYILLEKKDFGRSWTKVQIMQGLVTDIGELMELIMTKEGLTNKDRVDERLAHELVDCLWSILVLADEYGVKLEDAFRQNMDQLESKLDRNLASK